MFPLRSVLGLVLGLGLLPIASTAYPADVALVPRADALEVPREIAADEEPSATNPESTAPIRAVVREDERDGQKTAPLPLDWPAASAIERASQRALERGLAYLAQRQRESVDGAFPRGEAEQWAPVGVTALGALAFMAGGNSPGRGPYGAEVTRSIDYLLLRTDMAPESETRGYISTQGDTVSQTHGHGLATLALAEAFGMSPKNERLGLVLRAAVDRIQNSQGQEGGWHYSPLRIALHEGSVTVCYVQAMRAARNSGLRIEREVLQRAEDYILRLQKKDGTFRYQLDDERSSIALTAAGIGTLNMAGRYDSGPIQDGIDAIWKGLALREDEGSRAQFPYYERLFLAQAFWQMSDTSNFDRWWEAERERIVRSQDADGSWPDKKYGRAYATAMNCLVLAIPQGLLPIFQR